MVAISSRRGRTAAPPKAGMPLRIDGSEHGRVGAGDPDVGPVVGMVGVQVLQVLAGRTVGHAVEVGVRHCPVRSSPWQLWQPASAMIACAFGPPAALPDADGTPPIGGFSPDRLLARYTPPTRKMSTVMPIAQGGIAARAGLDGGVDGHRLSCQPPRRRRRHAVGRDRVSQRVLGAARGGVHQEQADEGRQAAERGEREPAGRRVAGTRSASR